MNDPIVNGQADLSNPQSRELWGKTHGLPKGFIIISDGEMARISQTVQVSSSENLKYRAVARLLFNEKTPQGLADAIKRLQSIHSLTTIERDKYRLALVEMAKAGNVVAQRAIQ